MSASYRIFDITLKSKTLISPSLVRCVFEGADIHRMKLEAPDQRIKLLFPAADGKIRSWSTARTGTAITRRSPKNSVR